MPLQHHEHQYTAPGTPPDRSRGASKRSTHKSAPVNSHLATLRTDAITPFKINTYPNSTQDEQMLSPLSQGTSINSTPFFTPRSSLSPVVPVSSILDQLMVSSDAGPTSAQHISKPLNPLFRPLLGSILKGGDAPPVSETAQGYQSGPIIISSNMLAADIIQHLINSGCSDVTDKLDADQCGKQPITGGGFGDIYQGVLFGGAKVAIKCPRLFLKNNEQGNRTLKNFAREIYAWSKLSHHNVLELIGLSIFRGQISIVSLWMENGTLTEYVSKHPEADRFQLCTQVSAALAYVHGFDIIHGDVKGANVLISGSGIAKLADFGNAVLKKHTIEFSEDTGGLKISVRWTAPELLQPEGQYTKEADIYALGMTFFEAVAGKMPFGGISEPAVLGTVLLGKTPERPGELDQMEEVKAETLWSIMSRCWAQTVANRPSASQVERILEGVEKGQVQEAHESIVSNAALTPAL